MNQDEINKKQSEINESVEKHLDVANQEMGVIKTEISWIKDSLKKLDDRTWWILGTVILGFIVMGAVRILFK